MRKLTAGWSPGRATQRALKPVTLAALPRKVPGVTGNEFSSLKQGIWMISFFGMTNRAFL